MRIGFDIRALHSQQRYQGVGYYTHSLLSALATIDQTNSYVLFGVEDDAHAEALAAQFRNAIYYRMYRPTIDQRFSEVWDQLLTPIEVAKFRLDAYFYPSLNRLAWWLPCAKVIALHDLQPLLWKQDTVKTGLKYKLFYQIARRTQRVVTLSESSRQDMHKLLGVELSRVAVTPAAADARFQSQSDQEAVQLACRSYGISRPFVLYIGELTASHYNKRKNLPLLLQTFAALTQKHTLDFQLVFGGKKGQHASDLQRLADELGVQEHVVFTDYIRDEDLPLLYAGASVFAYPSLYEGFGLPLLQAMACGTATIALRSSSIPEVVGDAGLLAEPNDARDFASKLEQLLLNAELRDQLAKHGLERARLFNWETTAALTLAAIDQAVRDMATR